jgi:hypothetical protein
MPPNRTRRSYLSREKPSIAAGMEQRVKAGIYTSELNMWFAAACEIHASSLDSYHVVNIAATDDRSISCVSMPLMPFFRHVFMARCVKASIYALKCNVLFAVARETRHHLLIVTMPYIPLPRMIEAPSAWVCL